MRLTDPTGRPLTRQEIDDGLYAPSSVFGSFRYAFASPIRLRKELTAGLAVSLALIPEAIAFAMIAGAAPEVGLYSVLMMAITMALSGGRPAIVTGATSAVAIVLSPLGTTYGTDYLLAAVILSGLIQLVLGLMGVALLERLIANPVMIGFTNALGLLLIWSQLNHFRGGWHVWALGAIGVLTMLFWERITKVIPGPLATVIILTSIAAGMGWDVPDVADMGNLPHSLPLVHVPNVPITLETLEIIGPTAIAVAMVGILTSIMTVKLADDITETTSNKTRETVGLGASNVIAGIFGGLAGAGMMGQSLISVREVGARTRLATLMSGVFVFVLVLGLTPVVRVIPQSALAAIMLIIGIKTIKWYWFKPSTWVFMPWSEMIVMALTIVSALLTENLAVGVLVGIVASLITLVRRIVHVVDVDTVAEGDTMIITVHGQIFWVGANIIFEQFDFDTRASHVIIDFSDAEIWDSSTVSVFDTVRRRYVGRGKDVEIRGLTGRSAGRMNKLSGHMG